MILDVRNNNPITAVGYTNADQVLAEYRDFAEHPTLTRDDLYKFITKPSAKRDEFLARLELQIEILSGRIITQTII